MGLLAAYFGVIAVVAAVFSMLNGAGNTVVGFVEVLVVMLVAGLCFSLAWVLIASARTRSQNGPSRKGGRS